jgi:hypothetical protein
VPGENAKRTSAFGGWLVALALLAVPNAARADGLAFSVGGGAALPGPHLDSDPAAGFHLTAGYGFSSIDGGKFLSFRARWRHYAGEQDAVSLEAHATVGPSDGAGPYAGGALGYGLWLGCLRGDWCGGEGLSASGEVGVALPLGHGRMALLGLELGAQFGMVNGVERVLLPSAVLAFTF